MTVPGPQQPGDGDLRQKVIHGIGWKLLSQGIVQVTDIGIGIVLAHLLSPKQFGLAAMAFVFSGIALIFTDLSLGAALVQRPVITERDRSTVFWTTAAAGLTCAVVGIVMSPSVAAFFGEPSVAPLFMAVSASFALTGVSATQAALLTRELAFKSLQLREIGASLAGAAVALVLAFAGFGAWALVAEVLGASGISAVLLWRLSPWRPRFTYSLESLRDLGSFGIKMFASRLLSYATLNGDNMLIGRFLSTAALGAYALAYNVMFTSLVRVSGPIQQVLFPALSRLQEESARLAQAWYRTTRMLGAVSTPAFLGLIVVAPDLITVVYGAKWQLAVRVLQLLSLAALAHSLQILNWSVLQASGNPGTLLRFQMLSATLNVTAFALGLRWGVNGVAGLFAVSRALLFFPSTWLTARAIGASARALIVGLGGIFLAAGGMFGGIYALRLFLVAEHVPAAARLVLVVVVGIPLFVGCARLATPDLVREARSILRRRRDEAAVPASAVG